MRKDRLIRVMLQSCWALYFFGIFIAWTGCALIPESATVDTRSAEIPKADPDRYSVLLADLSGDVRGEAKRVIAQELMEFGGVHVLTIEKEILLEESADPEFAAKKGHRQARDMLESSGASVIIWGKVLRYAGKSVPVLYWTSSGNYDKRGNRYRVSEEMRLPNSLPVLFGEPAFPMSVKPLVGPNQLDVREPGTTSLQVQSMRLPSWECV